MANETPTYLLLEERLGTSLAEHVERLRLQEAASWQHVALDLAGRTNVPVTPESLRNWFPQFRYRSRAA